MKKLQKIAELVGNNKFILNSIDDLIKKRSKQFFRKNLDYGERSPYYGNVDEFLKDFPGGIEEWLKWRDENEEKPKRSVD